MSFTEAAYSSRRRRRMIVRPGEITRRVLVTGAAGSIGEAVLPRLRERPDTLVFATDVVAADHDLDVTDPDKVRYWVATIRPTHILHLAGAKHAPEGETDPAGTFQVNTVGTANVLAAARGAKVVLASTCKACDPETAYGASKLIAERMVLNARGVVVRFFNVRETQGNVFRLWESIPVSEPIPYTDCWRYFISCADAAELTAAALDLPPGRYTVDPGTEQWMGDVAAALYPGRERIRIPARRGDRRREPFAAASERTERLHGTRFLRIISPHDPVWT